MSRREAPPRAPIRRALTQVRAATTLAHARPAYAAGLRAAIGTVAPLLLDHALGFGGGIWISLAGFSGALADKGGPYRTRAATLGALTAAGAAVAGLGALAAGHPALAIPLAFVVALLCSLGRAYGDAGASVGVTVLLIFVISLGFPS
ncbi:MAG: FUSC family protein, partial [Gemmatimonadales bacterium]